MTPPPATEPAARLPQLRRRIIIIEEFEDESIAPWILPPNNQEPCLFDGLEPGIYGISCPCPRCTPRY